MDGEQEKGVPCDMNLSTLAGVNKLCNSTNNDVIYSGDKLKTLQPQSKQKHPSDLKNSSRLDKTGHYESINNIAAVVNNNKDKKNQMGGFYEQQKQQKKSSHAGETRDCEDAKLKRDQDQHRQPMRSKSGKCSSSSSSTRSTSSGSSRSGRKCESACCESTMDCVVGKVHVLCNSTVNAGSSVTTHGSMKDAQSHRVRTNGGGKLINGTALGGLVMGEEAGRSKATGAGMGKAVGGKVSAVGTGAVDYVTRGGVNFEEDVERERNNNWNNMNVVGAMSWANAELICVSCQKMLQEPLQTPCCSHALCSGCLLPDIVSKKTCPLCLACPIDVHKLVIPNNVVNQLAKVASQHQTQVSNASTSTISSSSCSNSSSCIISCVTSATASNSVVCTSAESCCNNPQGCSKENKNIAMGIHPPHINSQQHKEKNSSSIVTSSTNITSKSITNTSPCPSSYSLYSSYPACSQSERQLIAEAKSLMTAHDGNSSHSNSSSANRNNRKSSELDHDCLIQINSEKFKNICNISGNNSSNNTGADCVANCCTPFPKSCSQNPQQQLTHDCISHVTKLVQGLQMRVASLESELKTRHSRYSKREKSLLSRISTLQNEMEMQALEFQERITSLTSQLYFTTLAAAENGNDVTNAEHTQQTSDDQNLDKFEKLEIELHRDENGALGFNISGGFRGAQSSPDVSSVQPDETQSPSSKLQINDQIIMVNETSLENVGHEEAVNIIKQSCDPVKFTVLRQIPRNASSRETEDTAENADTKSVANSNKEATSRETNTVACQTDPFLSFLSASDWCDGDLPPLPAFMDDPELWGSMTDIENLTCDASNCNDLISGASDDVIADLLHLNSYDIEYEEVILEKAKAEEKLGITVCRGAPNTSFSQMFVSKVEEDSVAALDGRVSVGDQVVQINGVPVSQSCDVTKLLDKDSPVTLLISRPLFNPKPNIFDLCEVEEQALDDLTASLLETEDECNEQESHYSSAVENNLSRAPSTAHDKSKKQRGPLNEEYPENIYDEPHENNGGSPNTESPSEAIREEEETAAETVSCYMDKDSGLDCDSSTRNDSHSETGEHDRTRSAADPFDFGFYTAESSVLSESNDYPNVKESVESCKPSGSVSFSQSLFRAGCTGTVQKLRNPDNFEEQSISSDLSVIVRDEFLFSDEEDDENVYENVDHILPDDEEAQEIKVPSPPPLPRPNMVTVNTSDLYQNLHSASKVLGKPPKKPNMDRSQSFSCAKVDKSNIADFQDDELLSPGGPKKDRGQSVKPYKQPKMTSSRTGHGSNEITSTGVQNNPACKKVPSRKVSGESKMTSSPSSRTFAEFNKRFSERSKMRRNESLLSIPAHAKQYRSYLQLVKLHEQQGNLNNQNLSSEWKVKIRPDGSRYITKVNAPMGEKKQKAKILRDRTEKMNKERAATCFTTDDEAVSEMKTGKYWSREERTRQYIVSMEKKHRKQVMENARMQVMDENLGLNLAQKKQMVGKAAALSTRDKFLDTFITIQEIMTHGSNLSANPLLSVTTV